ncbi:hypothetical protein [uncultured Erythrobacter sp.]|uniref:SecDF P1 head subdomain-containing protein n=1 Tax=uncultured Erythrobacter sp. TaxID=263913 RepID=UPI002612563F|nr:hypothetical protein [uncultured Erythrobacter sp.]
MILPLFPFLMVYVPDMSATDSPPAIFRMVGDEGSGASQEIELCTDTVVTARIEANYLGYPTINLTLTESAGARMAALTSASVGEQAEISVEGSILVRPRIQTPMLEQSFSISGLDTFADAERLMQAVRGRCVAMKADTE